MVYSANVPPTGAVVSESPFVRSLEVIGMMPDWGVMAAVTNGTNYLRDMSETYLPQEPREDDDAYQLAMAMENARLTREVAQQERLERELEVGRDIQASFLFHRFGTTASSGFGIATTTPPRAKPRIHRSEPMFGENSAPDSGV